MIDKKILMCLILIAFSLYLQFLNEQANGCCVGGISCNGGCWLGDCIPTQTTIPMNAGYPDPHGWRQTNGYCGVCALVIPGLGTIPTGVCGNGLVIEPC